VGETVIRTIDAPRHTDVPADLAAFLRWLGGPAWIAVPGRDRGRVRAVVTLIHGNEPSGVRAVHGWLRTGAVPAVDTVFLIASVEAALAPPGFAHRMLPERGDLNRRFLPPYAGSEGALAREVVERLRATGPETLIDLHNNTGHNPAYGVGPVMDTPHLALTALFGRHFVHSDLELGALVEATQRDFPSVTIECGRAGDPTADAAARVGLDRYLSDDAVLEDRPPARDMDVLIAPIRVSVRPGLRVAFGAAPRPEVAFTVAEDIDRHNFERVPPGAPIGWVEDGIWPLEAHDAGGREIAREMFEVTDGTLRARRSMIPIMMTTDATVALSDCLFYAVRRAPPSDVEGED
jgi:hypothetical protein